MNGHEIPKILNSKSVRFCQKFNVPRKIKEKLRIDDIGEHLIDSAS